MNIKLEEKLTQYDKLLKNELNYYFNNLTLLYKHIDIIKKVKNWEYSKCSSVIYPHPYHDELIGYKTGKLVKKKFNSLEDAFNKEHTAYGFDNYGLHIITIKSSSEQFGTTCQIFLYEENLIKMITVRYLYSYYQGNHFHISKEKQPELSGIRYFFWLSNTEQIILTRGKANKDSDTNIQKIIYQHNIPYKYISYSGGSRMDFDFIYKNSILEKIKDTNSNYLIYEK